MSTDTEAPYQVRKPHPVVQFLRSIRRKNGLSLAQMESVHKLSAVVIGAYERGDRNPPLWKLEQALNVFGYRLAVLPVDDEDRRLATDDVPGTLRELAEFLERSHHDADV